MGYVRAMMRSTLPRPIAAILILAPLAVLAACTSGRTDDLKEACNSGIEAAEKELLDARAKGFRGGVDITQAASLIGAAKVQYEFKRYPNCVDKVKRARIHIAKAQER